MGSYTGRFLGALVIFAALTSIGTATLRAQDTASTNGSSDATDSSGASVDAYKQQLQNQLNAINAQITQQQQVLTQEEAQSQSLQNTIDILNAQIKSAKLAIQARDITIEELTSSITDKENTVFGLNSQLNAEKDSLAGILREQNQLESTPLAVALLSSQDLSSFFSDLDSFDSINASLEQSFAQISSTTVATQAEEDALQTQLEQESQLRQVQALQEQQIANQQAQENQLLSETKGQEANYVALIASNQKSAAQIRTELFQLNGSAAIPFDKALQYADLAEQKTGIRPAFLLGIIKEESDLGNNVGTGSYLVDMSPANQPIFIAITQSLGLNPAQMPVSARQWYGWGGAMGPAQFIPSTWAIYAGYPKPLFQYKVADDRIGAITGDTPPNPWEPEDAFIASALYLTDDGAGAQTPAAEFKAAMCYLAGCGNVDDQSLWFYGNQVLCNELTFQEDIDTITGSNDAAAMKSNSLYYGQC